MTRLSEFPLQQANGTGFQPLRWSTGCALTALLCGSLLAFAADLKEAKEFMAQRQPNRAGEVLRTLAQEQPQDPWLAYNLAVAAYAVHDYAAADRVWQDLAARELPPALRDQTWLQIGNAAFRMGEQTEAKAADLALPQFEQSREAYRIVLAARPRDRTAAHNLRVVELKLARLHTQLAQRLVKEAQNQSLNESIAKLDAALDHQRTARELDPENQDYQQQAKRTEQQLAGKHNERAAQQERNTDETLRKPEPQSWEMQQAEEKLKAALSDFQEAESLDSQNQTAQQGEKRVEEKLANLLAKQGREQQREGENEQQWSPDKAEESYAQALEKFAEAQSLVPNHAEARKGEREVQKALEQLHERQGDKLAKEGRQEAPRQPEQGAEKMLNALDHYEQAQEMNPTSESLPPKIEALEKELPPLLNSLGKKEQQAAAKAEARSPDQAIAHLEKAATSFEIAEQLDKQNQEAQQGQEQVQKDLARLREQVAQKAEAKTQQQGKQPAQQSKNPAQAKQQAEQNFQSLLAEVKDPERQKEYDESRRGKPSKYDPDQNRIHKNW